MKVKPILITNKGVFKNWIQKRPDSIKSLAKEFPLGVVWKINNVNLVVIGWNESDAVLFSKLYLLNDQRPDIDKMLSQEERIHICADHLRMGEYHEGHI